MNKKEKLLFKELCSFKSKTFDSKIIDASTPCVLGNLFFNRMQAVAYGELKRRDLLSKVNREFRNSLKQAYERNIEKNRCYFLCLKHVSQILKQCTHNYALLKGAYLCGKYPQGYRTSNDIDILVLPEGVTEVGTILKNAGFKQGYIKNDEFVMATRKEIIESKFLRGETVPYVREVNLPSMKYLEVDINFSLDYKNDDTAILRNMLERTVLKQVGNMQIRTLDSRDFFIHLCAHLYKEATTMPWVEMKRDMTLYKYCDIYALLEEMIEGDVSAIFNRARELGMEKICAFAILQTAELFKVSNYYAIASAKSILKSDMEFLHCVISPKDKKKFIYTEKDIFKRFFATERKKLLKEVN